MENPDKREDIYAKLIKLFENNPESLVRILFYIDQEDLQYKDDIDKIPPVLRILKTALNNDKVFKIYAERLAEDTKEAVNNEKFRKVLTKLYEQMLDPTDAPLEEELYKDWDIACLTDVNHTSAFMGLAYTWDVIPVYTQTKILEMIPKVLSDKRLVSMYDDVVSLVNKTSGTVVMYGLAALYLSYVAIYNLYRWCKGEISGKRCAQKIVVSIVSMAASVGCGIGGAALGTMLAGPIGTVCGGIFGSVGGSAVVNLLIDKLTLWIFNLPKEEALENAYTFFGVTKNASNDEINTSFRKLCLKHHPDKGGDKENFLLVQIHMGMIKYARYDLL